MMITIILLLTVSVYTRGLLRLRDRVGSDHSVKRWQVVAFGSGIMALAAALVSPLDRLSESVFTAHMVQHLLLMVVAAPLIAFSKPLVPLLWGIPQRGRQLLRGWQRYSALSAIWRVLTHPLVAWSLHTLALWLWHLPSLYQAALHDGVVHIFEHVSFMGTALLYWWTIAHPQQSTMHGWNVLSLFAMSLQSGLLGALLMFSTSPWYPVQSGSAASWGITPLEDQQLAGLIMWIPSGMVYVGAGLALLMAWLHTLEQRTRLREEGQN